ncbi:MAG: YncE family protein [Longimicrobiales bacterium]
MIQRIVGITVCALLTACAPGAQAGGTAADGPSASVSSPARFAYVTNQNDATVSVIDMADHRVTETVDLQALGFSANAKPHHIEVEPDGSFWYVSLIGDNAVLKFDRQNRVVGRTTFEVPGILALHPTEDILFVGRSMSAVNPPHSIGMIRRSDMTLLAEQDVFFGRPHALGAANAGPIAWVASLASNRWAAVDFAEEDVALVELPGDETHVLVEFAISPDGGLLVGTAQLTNQVFVYDVTDPMAPELLRRIPVGVHPWHPAFSPDGRWLWVPNKMSNSISLIDTRSWEVVDTITGRGLAQPHGSAVSPDGRWVFVSNNNLAGDHMEGHAEEPGTVVVIDTGTHEIVQVLTIGHNPTGLGAPDLRG